MKMPEIISKSTAQLAETLAQLRKEQMNLRFQKAAGQLANPNRWRQVRQTIARVKTAISMQTINTKEGK
ncbi:MAG: 50S ribosomal protein L29 [Proteobacteria bacterium]|nr:50S ribosomal protein L29 [Pseudomonadota bacterium]NBX85762.1 50S ribosomal protein L29 [Pseudomonadota bacterium]